MSTNFFYVYMISAIISALFVIPQYSSIEQIILAQRIKKGKTYSPKTLTVLTVLSVLMAVLVPYWNSFNAGLNIICKSITIGKKQQ